MKTLLHTTVTAILLCTVIANADLATITLNGVADGVIKNFTIIPTSSPDMTGPTLVNAQAYTGLYTATVTSNGVSQQWQTYCIDPVGDINIGTSWNANLLTSTDLTSSSQEGVLYAGSYGSTPGITQEKYAMISYLANQYYYGSNAYISNAADRSDLSLAFWEIARDFDGNSTSLDVTNGNFYSSNLNTADLGVVNTLLAQAYDNRNGSIDLAVYRPTDRPSQEFIAFKVPEPATLGMLLAGLLSLCGLSLARRKTA